MAVRKIRKTWWVDLRWQRERYRMRSPHNSRAGAESYEAELRKKLAQGEGLVPLPGETITFADFSRQWFETYVRTNNKSSEQRSKSIVLRLHLVPHFGLLPLARIKARQIEAYKSMKLAAGLSPKTINNHLFVLGKCLRTAVEWEYVASAPRIKLLRQRPPSFDFLTPAESRRLLSGPAPSMWTNMARVALRTGMRRGELCALDWSAIDLERAMITVRHRLYRKNIDSPKNNRVRYLPMTDDVSALLRQQEHREGLLFHRPDGSPLAETTVTREIRALCLRVGLRPVGWHVLRHTFASRLVTEGVPLPAVQELLGHSSITMTMRYAHLAPSTLRSAIRVLEDAEARDVLEKDGQPVVNATDKGLSEASLMGV